MKEEKRRYVGIDLGKREYTMVIIGMTGKMSIHKGKTSIHPSPPSDKNIWVRLIMRQCEAMRDIVAPKLNFPI
jgi:hypothetical protein